MSARVCTHPWEYHTEGFCIAGNLYYVGNTNVSCHLIDTGEGLILIDSGYPQTVYLLLESIRNLGFNPMNNGEVIIINVPVLTEERRITLSNLVSESVKCL